MALSPAEPTQRASDMIPRVGGVLGFGALLAHRVSLRAHYPSQVVWALELAHAGVMVFAYVVREPVRGRAVGWTQRYLPFLIPGLTFLLVYQPLASLRLLPIAKIFLGIGVGIECVAIWYLRRSFSIMVEARSLITRGPYRFARHPIYVGGTCAALGALLLRLTPLAGILFLAFVAGEIYRARLEERKLEAYVPEYAAYKARVPMFGLRLFRRRGP